MYHVLIKFSINYRVTKMKTRPSDYSRDEGINRAGAKSRGFRTRPVYLPHLVRHNSLCVITQERVAGNVVGVENGPRGTNTYLSHAFPKPAGANINSKERHDRESMRVASRSDVATLLHEEHFLPTLGDGLPSPMFFRDGRRTREKETRQVSRSIIRYL